MEVSGADLWGKATIKNPRAFGALVFTSIRSPKRAWFAHECKNPQRC